MNRKIVFRTFGRIALVEGVILLFPALISLIYGEYRAMWSLAVTAAGSALLGFFLYNFIKPDNTVIYAREGFATVAVTWVGMSLIGTLPFVISGEIPNFFDAFFEVASGFSTTGASILTDVESLSRGMLFWRSFTHWLGGMGVLVFIMAIANNISDRTIHIMRAEVPGPVVGKLVPKVRDTAKMLYLLYIALTALEMIFLCAGGMTPYESAVHAFGTAGTGGFGIYSDSIAGYNHYIQWVITVFMILFGVNFNIYYLILVRKFRAAFSGKELWVYFGILAASIIAITANISHLYPTFGESFRQASFTTASIVSTTGYSVSDFNAWPQFSRSLIFVLMFFGGCAGSTSGGLKISRIMLLFKMGVREVRKLIRPRSVNTVTSDEKPVEEGVLRSVATYFAVYIGLILVSFLAISFEPFGFESNFTAVVSCVNNIGPGLGVVGPAGSYAGYSVFSKIILSLDMLFGRLEIFPLLIALFPATWRRNRA